MGTQVCYNSYGRGVSEMSNNSRQHNNILLNELAMIHRAEQRKRCGKHEEDNRIYNA